jgi:hypothetical protein
LQYKPTLHDKNMSLFPDSATVSSDSATVSSDSTTVSSYPATVSPDSWKWKLCGKLF